VQGTVARFDPFSGAGRVLLDDGTPVEFDGAAFAASGLRLLRVGQRVRLDQGPDRTVVRVTLVTM
jgi:2-phospho-L-lactate guanylyltransferase